MNTEILNTELSAISRLDLFISSLLQEFVEKVGTNVSVKMAYDRELNINQSGVILLYSDEFVHGHQPLTNFNATDIVEYLEYFEADGDRKFTPESDRYEHGWLQKKYL